MNVVDKLTLGDKSFKRYISQNQISEIVAQMASEMNNFYKHKTVYILGVLNGAFIFTGDICRKFDFQCEISFLRANSYIGTQSSGSVRIELDPRMSIAGKHVLVLEDIMETGKTANELLPLLKLLEPESLKFACLFYKEGHPNRIFEPDFIGRRIGNEFIVGYGLDYRGLGRNLQEVWILDES